MASQKNASIRFAPRPLASALVLLSLTWATPSSARHQGDGPRVERKEVHVLRGVGDEPILMMHGLAIGRTFLGVHLVNLTSELMDHFGAAGEAGVMVSRVAEKSPAAEAGLRVGDILTAIDGEPIRSAGHLARQIASREAGDRVTLELWRRGKLASLSVTLATSERPQFDVRPFLWHPGHEEHGDRLLIPGGALRGQVEIDRETLDDALETLRRHFDSEDLQNRIRFFQQHGEGLLKRLEELEERLESLERELEKLPADGP